MKIFTSLIIITYYIEHFTFSLLIFTPVNRSDLALNQIRRFISTIPPWAFALVLLAIYVNTIFFITWCRTPMDTHTLVFLLVMYILMILFSIGSLGLLYKKPKDKAVLLFFIYLQLLILTVNADYLDHCDLFSMTATVAFIVCGHFLGPTLVHFQLLFPKPAKIIIRYKRLPIFLYAVAGLHAIILSAIYIQEWIDDSLYSPIFQFFSTISIWWLFGNFILAIAVTIYQYRTIKDTLSRNQLKIIFTGIFFSFVLVFYLIFQEPINKSYAINPFLLPLINSFTRLILICCILIAIFSYRIWNIEIIFKKVLLYMGATLVILLSYFLLLHLVDLFTTSESKSMRFFILAVSVIIFLVMRDRIQRLIERIFHREPYDSATVVSDFEGKLAGIYRFSELKSGIVQGLDEIFHFKSFVLILNKNEFIYEPAFILGIDNQSIDKEFEINAELENKLCKSRIFSPGELAHKHEVIEVMNGELVVPILKDDRPFGFFICGPKKSEKNYSMQDIRVLALIAKRVIALFHTAELYQKDLDRQLMLERERARISQDMHDDIGASLTRISMMSEMVKNRQDVGDGARQWLGQISGTSRGVMEEMNQIIWALNPKNDNLEGLILYIRRFAFEYVEPTTVTCLFELPESLPVRALSVEVRRNVYLCAREAIHNVVKHSGASIIRINLEVSEHGFLIRIKDNGKGFDPGKLEYPGNGLVNMKKRMNDIGGEIIINSKIGIGTEILIDVAR